MTSLEKTILTSKKLRPRTKELYLQHVRAFLQFLHTNTGSTSARHYTAKAVTAWRDDMQRRRIKAQSINVALNALRFAAKRANLTFADDIEALPVKAKSAKRKGDRPLRADEGRRLLDACRGNKGRDLRDMALIQLGLRTGMLRFSICQLRFSDLDGNRLTFTKKGGDQHTIRLDPTTHYTLTAWMDWLRNQDIDDGYIFRSLGRNRVNLAAPIAISKKLTPDGLYRAVQARARKANLAEPLGPHVFRKTFIAWAKRAGARPAQIAAVTGHKSDAAGDESAAAGDESAASPSANFLLPSDV